MTKAELEIELKKALDKIEEQKHLAEAVEAKDKEIVQLREVQEKQIEQIRAMKEREIAELKEQLQKEREKQEKQIEQIRAMKEREIAELKKQLQEKQVQMLSAENLKKENELLKNTLTRREKELNKLIILHGNLLKALQGNLDNAIELNEYFINEVSK
jgi:predicted S18 family serine protease